MPTTRLLRLTRRQRTYLFWRRMGAQFGSQAIAAAIGVVIGLVLLCGIVFTIAEWSLNPNAGHPGAGFQYVGVAIITGSQPYKAVTTLGKISYYLILIVRPGIFGIITAWAASQLLQLVLRRGQGRVRAKVKDQIVICGWSSKGNEIITEIRGRLEDAMRPVVVLAEKDSTPTRDPMTTFVRGDPTNEEDLRRAGIERAHTAILLADNSYPDIDIEEMDAKTLMTALAVEELNPNCYTCVEIIHSENLRHFERTRANELLVSGRMTGAMLAHSAVTHGLSRVLSDLITHPEGNEFYWVDVPPRLIGHPFEEVLLHMKRDHDCTVVAMSEASGGYVTNPPGARPMGTGDRLLVIAAERPVPV